MSAPTKRDAGQEIARFQAEYGAKYPKAVASLTKDSGPIIDLYGLPGRSLDSLALDERD